MINLTKQQESSPFTTVGKTFENTYILHGYYIICIHHKGTIWKHLSLFLSLTKQHFYELRILACTLYT